MGLNLCCLIFHTKKKTLFSYIFFFPSKHGYMFNVCVRMQVRACARVDSYTACVKHVCACVLSKISSYRYHQNPNMKQVGILLMRFVKLHYKQTPGILFFLLFAHLPRSFNKNSTICQVHCSALAVHELTNHNYAVYITLSSHRKVGLYMCRIHVYMIKMYTIDESENKSSRQ